VKRNEFLLERKEKGGHKARGPDRLGCFGKKRIHLLSCSASQKGAMGGKSQISFWVDSLCKATAEGPADCSFSEEREELGLKVPSGSHVVHRLVTRKSMQKKKPGGAVK